MAKLTDKQARFVDEYCIDLNATQAAIRAGYSPRTAKEQGYQLVHNTSLIERIEQKQKQAVEDLRKRFTLDAVKAREVMYEILTDEEAADKDKITVARDFLDRAGFKPDDKVKLDGIVRTVIVDDLDG